MFAHASNYFPFTMYLSEKNFALLGMAGIMSGVMHAPLTGVFLIAELTGGYALFLPLMIVSVSSYINDQDVSSTQYLFDASGPERGVAYPS